MVLLNETHANAEHWQEDFQPAEGALGGIILPWLTLLAHVQILLFIIFLVFVLSMRLSKSNY
ncbi:hypothetical protein MUK42_37770 [Musa troglodytarum]|uniref:Uncharacterized protein n=1 Tax=Musa troglodytarum TaxID=320322 RepID=A0A9E7K5A9_9LILI|nr:hypothetical protein MUK42_37770 [Musa troglodytarum]